MKGKLSFMWRATLALVLVLSLGVVMAVPVSAAGALTGESATAPNLMAGVTTDYTIKFTPAEACDIASVDMDFATLFDVSGATLGTVSGIGVGALEPITTQTVTYTVGTPATVSGEITIPLDDIVNPTVATTYDPAVTITTKNQAGGTIDIGSAAVTITAAPVSFAVEVGDQIAGEAFKVTITAKDAAAGGGSAEEDYTGLHLIDFSSTATDPKTIPAFEMVDFNLGVGQTSTSFVLNKVETGRTITATDTELNVKGTSSLFSVALATVDYITITGAPTLVIAGEAFADDIIVTAYDAAGNVMTTDSTSNIHWTSTEGTDVLPADHLLVDGTWTFSGSGFILKAAGALDVDEPITLPRPITATVDGNKIRAVSIIVNPAAASQLAVAADPGAIAANGYASSVITATVLDEFSNLVKTSTDVTFETSVGEFANGDSTYTVAFAYHGSPDYTYYAEATLTSTDVGKATVKVTSGSLTYATAPVTLTLDTAPTEVWVDGDYESDLYNDGHDWEVDAFITIQGGIDAVAAGGTVNVLPGTYDLVATTLEASKAGITVQSTGTTALTPAIIDADGITGTNAAISIHADDVTFDGFTLDGAAHDGIWIWYGTTGVTVQNNIITEAESSAIILMHDLDPYPTSVVTEATVSNNVIEDCFTGISMLGCATDCTISDNTITGSTDTATAITFGGGTVADPTQDNAITGNTITNNAGSGIFLFNGSGVGFGGVYFDDNLIEGNTISANLSSGIKIVSGLTITDLTITGNDITSNWGDGIKIESWDLSNAIDYNNIYDNTDSCDIRNDVADIFVDAENNWWGQTGGPAASKVEGRVDYSPWLAAPYSAPATTISLESGWNLISLMLLPTDEDIDIVLAGADVTVNKVAYYTGGPAPAGSWKSWFPSPPIDLYTMGDGKGYWMDVSAAGTLTVTGVELALPGEAPPTYDVVVGWNLIGFTSTTAKTVDVYLGSVLATVEAMYGYNAATDLYEAVLAGSNLASGQGYWLAVNTAGKIYP